MAFSDPRDRIIALVPDWESFELLSEYVNISLNRQEMIDRFDLLARTRSISKEHGDRLASEMGTLYQKISAVKIHLDWMKGQGLAN